MEYIGYVFGIFGLVAYLQCSSLKSRIENLESQLAKLEGTSFHEDRQSLMRMAKAHIGERVKIEFREDLEDTDVIMYGNTRNSSNVITDVDDDWIKVLIESPKVSKEKLIRIQSVQSLTIEKSEGYTD